VFFRKKQNIFDLKEILEGCQRKHSSAQKRLFEHFYGLAMGICLRYAANKDEAEEMLNDGFMKVFDKIDYYDPEQVFEAWFRTVVVRTSIDYFRKNHNKVAFMDVEDAHFLAHEDHHIEQLAADEIMELVQKLPPAYRTVFSLYVVEGYSHNEIAEMLEINPGTSRSNLAKARIKMQEWIKIYASETLTNRNHV
jgi:RNA polymerase sigma-70 factor (ECF subfamily)